MLKTQKRHQSPCTRPEWDQRSCAGKGADCPILIVGTLKGKRIRLSTAKFLPPEKARDLQAARDLAILWERVGSAVRAEEYATVAAPLETAPTPTLPMVEMAVEAYLADARARGNSISTVYKKEGIFARRFKVNPKDKAGAKRPASTSSLLSFCDRKGVTFLEELEPGHAVGMEGNVERELAGTVEETGNCDWIPVVLREARMVFAKLRGRCHAGSR